MGGVHEPRLCHCPIHRRIHGGVHTAHPYATDTERYIQILGRWNMNPWDIIGWGILLSIPFLLLVIILIRTWMWSKGMYRHFRTGRKPPKTGQLWTNWKGDDYWVTSVGDRIHLSTAPPYSNRSHASWADTQHQWKQRVIKRRLYLER